MEMTVSAVLWRQIDLLNDRRNNDTFQWCVDEDLMRRLAWLIGVSLCHTM